MESSTLILLYLILSGISSIFFSTMFFYIFNKKVLSKLKISIKLLIYSTLLSIIFAFLEYEILTNINLGNIYNNIWALCLIFVIYLFFMFVSFLINLQPIKKIQLNLEKLSNGTKFVSKKVQGSSEFNEIQQNLTSLAQMNINNEEYKLKLKKEYYKFIPKQFYDYLNKQEVFDLTLGTNIQKDVCILFCDIRNSLKTSETLSLDDNFKFINSYLTIVGECVRKNNGFIDKFLGDGVLAVFLSETDCLNASTQISNNFENQNLVSTNDKIHFGIGIHSGKAVIGIVGDKERLNPTIISENVNLASKIETLNKVFKTRVLFSKETLNNLPKSYEINYRYIGTINIDNSEYVSLFENLDAFVGANKQILIKTKNMFEMAVRNFESKDYSKARNLFIKILEENDDDNLSRFYLKKCQINLKK